MEKELKDYTDEELKSEYVALDQMIYKVQCYGTSDIRLLLSVAQELEKRGIGYDYEISFD